MAVCALITLVLHFNFFWRLRVGFPHLSVFGVAVLVPPSITATLWLLELLFLLGILFSDSLSWLFHSLHILWACFWFLLDQNIWCPQLAHFSVISWSILLHRKSPLQVFTFFLYFYGGLQKLNHCFLYRGKGISDFSRAFLQRLLRFDVGLLPRRLLEVLSLASALLEILIALLFLFPPTVPLASLLGVLTHVVILLCVGPLGSNSCHGIWAWNALCLVILPSIFPTSQPFLSELWQDLSGPCLASLALWGVLPLLNMTGGAWSDEVSFKLHSMNFGFCTMKIFPPDGVEDVQEYYNMVARKVPKASGVPFVDINGVVEVDHIARQYSHSPCSAAGGALLWAKYLAEEWKETILFTFYYSPARLDGTRRRAEYLVSPGGGTQQIII